MEQQGGEPDGRTTRVAAASMGSRVGDQLLRSSRPDRLAAPLDRILGEVAEVLALVDPAALSVAEAKACSAAFVALGKLADAGAVLVAAQAVQGDPAGVGAATVQLARSAGISKAEAERTVATSKALAELPATRTALVAGRLSRTQAAIVAEAAKASPRSEQALLDTAALQDNVGLRRHADATSYTTQPVPVEHADEAVRLLAEIESGLTADASLRWRVRWRLSTRSLRKRTESPLRSSRL